MHAAAMAGPPMVRQRPLHANAVGCIGCSVVSSRTWLAVLVVQFLQLIRFTMPPARVNGRLSGHFALLLTQPLRPLQGSCSLLCRVLFTLGACF
jgi:hypothetical protein